MIKKFLLGLSICVVSLGQLASEAQAGLIYYNSQASFDASGAVVSTQTFASANVNQGQIQVMGNTLNSATNNGIFSTGSILPGLSLYASGNNPGSDLAIVGVGFNNYANKSVFSNFNNQTLNIAFSSGMTAASLGLLSYANVNNIDIFVYNTANVLIGTTTAFNVQNFGAGMFLGITATAGDVIGRIEINSQGTEPSWQGIDRAQFGQVVPVPGSLTLAGIGIAFLAVGRSIRSKKVS